MRSTAPRRWAAAAVLGVVALTAAVAASSAGGGPTPAARHVRAAVARRPRAVMPASARSPSRSYAVGLRVLRLVDRSRRVRLATGRVVFRTLVTDLRYPAQGPASRTDVRDAPPATAGPYPLVVFGHGFTLLPSTYALLLRAWARAGFVVAAPAFPLEKATAPGGPVESDIVNQPGDMSFVISRLEAASSDPAGPLHGLVDPRRVAVAGHSDGGETALAVAYDRRYRDPRVRAAVILSGAAMIGGGRLRFPRRMRPLLAVQGTADPVHPPQATYAVFAAAGRPKYLLRLLGAGHESPYTTDGRLRRIVERVSIAFLDLVLRGARGPAALAHLGNLPGVASLTARP